MTAARAAHVNIPSWGIDLPRENRPGVPYEHAPHAVPGSHWITPVRQVAHRTVLKRADLARLTPVFGTAQPPHGLSGELRRVAYTIPDHRVRHWLLLFAADRVDVIESDLGGFVKRAWPAVAIAIAAGVAIGARRRRRRSWRLF